MKIKMHKKHVVLSAVIVALLAVLPAFAADGDKSKIKGLITGIQGNTVTVKGVQDGT